MFRSRGIRFADTIDELRLFAKHENKQMFGVIENGCYLPIPTCNN